MATYSPKDPEKRLAKLRQAKSEGFYSPARIDGKRVDGMTAGVILAVYEALNAENRAKLIEMPYPKMRGTAVLLAERHGHYTVGARRNKRGRVAKVDTRAARRAGLR